MGGPAWERCPANPTEGRSSVSTEQKEDLDAILRQSAFPADMGVSELRRLLVEQASAQPLPAGVTVTAAALGGIPTAEITIDGIEPRHVVLYFHGGVYVLEDAFQVADLARSGGGLAPRSSRWTTGSPPSTPTRPRSTTPWPPTRPCCRTAPTRSPASRSPGSPPADSPSPPWSMPATMGCPCQPQPSLCHRTPTSPCPGRAWKPRPRPTRCSAENSSSPGSRTIRRDKTPLPA